MGPISALLDPSPILIHDLWVVNINICANSNKFAQKHEILRCDVYSLQVFPKCIYREWHFLYRAPLPNLCGPSLEIFWLQAWSRDIYIFLQPRDIKCCYCKINFNKYLLNVYHSDWRQTVQWPTQDQSLPGGCVRYTTRSTGAWASRSLTVPRLTNAGGTAGKMEAVTERWWYGWKDGSCNGRLAGRLERWKL